MSNPLVKPKRAIQRGSNPLRRPTRQIRKPSGSSSAVPATSSNSNASAALAKLSVSDNASKGTPSTIPGNSNKNKKLPNKPNQVTAEYKLHACKAEDVQNLRYHIMRFHTPGRKPVDPVNDFTKPIRLHRKDPRNMQNQLTLAELEERNRRMGITTPIPKSVLQEAALAEAKQAEALAAEANSSGVAAATATNSTNDGDVSMENVENENSTSTTKEQGDDQKTKAPEVDMSLVAPDGGARRNKANLFQKKTKQVILGDPNARRLRYEEFYPWVMEDFDGQNTWVGNFEAGQMSQYVLFVFDKDGFKMVPAERWYKMTPRNKYATLTLEEVEKHMDSRDQPDRWVMKYFGDQGDDETQKRPLNARRRFRATDTTRDDEDGLRKDDDGNEIDFDDEFADDEEAPIMDGNEEDVKEVEKKIKKEQQAAKFTNLFDEHVEEEGDDQKVDKQGRNIIKSLRSLEKNSYYSDDDSNPYASEDSSSEEEVAAGTEEGADKDVNGIKKEGEGEADVTGQANSVLSLDEKSRKEKKLKDKKAKKEKKKKMMKRHHDLPRGMVILSLPSSKLSQFPENLWNPGLKRRRADSETEEGGHAGEDNVHKSKKIKIKVSNDETTTPSKTGDSFGNGERDSPALSKPISALSLSGNTNNTVEQSSSTSNAGNAAASGSRVSTTSSGYVSPRPPSAASSETSTSSAGLPDLLQEEEITEIIRKRRLTAKELLAELKHRIKKDPKNLVRLKSFAKKVAKLHDGYLVLREPK